MFRGNTNRLQPMIIAFFNADRASLRLKMVWVTRAPARITPKSSWSVARIQSGISAANLIRFSASAPPMP